MQPMDCTAANVGFMSEFTSIVREYVLYEFLKIQKTRFYVFFK